MKRNKFGDIAQKARSIEGWTWESECGVDALRSQLAKGAWAAIQKHFLPSTA